MKNMTGRAAPFVIQRAGMIKFMELYVTSTKPSGLRIADGEQFEQWVESLKQVAVVKTVAPGSPAELAGLQSEDQIVWCYNIVYNAKNAFQQLLQIIKYHQDKPLIMYIKRSGDVEQLVVTPTAWKTGKGLTGMSIAPK